MNVVSPVSKSCRNALAEKHDESLVYYVFDLPWAEGHDLSKLPLVERKQILRSLLSPDSKRQPPASR